MVLWSVESQYPATQNVVYNVVIWYFYVVTFLMTLHVNKLTGSVMDGIWMKPVPIIETKFAILRILTFM